MRSGERRASALVFHSRSARALNTMSEKEAEAAGIDLGQRRFYFRIDNGKSNCAPPPERSEWRKIESIDLGITLSCSCYGPAMISGDFLMRVRWRFPGVSP